MSIQFKNCRALWLVGAAALSGCICQSAYAQDGERAVQHHDAAGAGAPEHAPRGEVFREDDYREPRFLDSRYHHDHYYPPLGSVFAALPEGAARVDSPDDDLYLAGGVWYREEGSGRYVVVTPDIGTTVPAVPKDCTSVLLGGVPYCYANGTYYLEAPDGYLVADPPASNSALDVPSTASAPPSAPPN